MPELPEVEVAARSLRSCVHGLRIVAFEVRDTARIDLPEPERMIGRLVHNVRRIGKQIVLDLDSDLDDARRIWLAVHLRMTGRLLVLPHNQPAAATKHLRAQWRFDNDYDAEDKGDGSWLAFVDPRRFGTIRLHESRRELTPHGLDPLSKSFTPQRLGELLAQARTAPLKTWLLRQDRIVGLGNIYASEILFAAGLHPQRHAADLRSDEVERLHAATQHVLREAIRHCGTTFSDFQDSRGELGQYQQYLTVYGRQGQPCHVCATPIEAQLQAGRRTFWCTHCQPKSKARRKRGS